MPDTPTGAQIREWAKGATDDVIKETLIKASGQETARSFADLDAEQSKLRQAFQVIEDVKSHLGGKEFRKMMKEAAKTAKKVASA